MKLKTHLSVAIILLTLCMHSEQQDDWKFPVYPYTKKPKTKPNVHIRINGPSATQKSLVETNRRIDGLEPQMTKIQKSLDALLKLHGMRVDRLKMYKPCDNMSSNIDNKLENMKNDIINEMDEKQKEQSRFSYAKLEKIKQDIAKIVGQNFKDAGQAMFRLTKEVDSIHNRLKIFNKQIVNCEMKSPSLALPVVFESPRNCKEVLEQGNVENGIYAIKPTAAPEPFEVLCDMETQGGGWTYFMNRFDGSQDFYLNWTDYKNGFGDLEGEFWLGLEHLYELTGSVPYELLFILTDWEGKTVHANFKQFSIGSESERYAIKLINGYSGDAGHSFFFHRNKKFSTLDKQDEYGSCVERHHGPWWYGSGCYTVKLTGKYFEPEDQTYAMGIHYNGFHVYNYSLKEVAMMVRP